MDPRKPSSLELPRPRSATVGSARSGKSSKSAEEFGNKPGTSTKSSITSSFKSFASNLIRSKPAPTPEPATTEVPPPSLLRPETPPPAQGPGPHTVRLIPSPGPNLLPRSRSAADLLEGVSVPAPAFDKVANELAEAERILGDEEPEAARVSFGFGTAGYDDEGAQDISMVSVSLPVLEQDKENKPAESLEQSGAFVFGSPQHSVTNTQFGDVAVAVLREMNARMGVANSSQAMSLQQLEDVLSNAGKPAAPMKVEKKTDVRFVARHDKDFAKMDSIANHYSVRSRKRKSEHTTDVGDTTTDSKLFTVPPRLSTATAADDSERTTKRARISTVDDKPTAGGKAAKDSPAVRAQLEKRRQSARASGGVAARKSGGTTQQQPPARGGFGFMKMVRGIWGSKEKEKEKEKPKEQPKEEKENQASDIAKKFPSAPTDDPLPNLPAAPKNRIVSGSKKSIGPSKIAPKAGSVGPESGRTSPPAPKPRVASGGLFAPTAASLARQATTATTATKSSTSTNRSRGLAAVTAPAKPVVTKATLVPSVKLPSPPTTDPAKSDNTNSTTHTSKPPATVPSRPASRALPVPPTTVARAATSGAATQGSARAVSPPVRSATVGKTTSPLNGRKSIASPGSKSPRASIFKQPLTRDAMTMRGSAPTVQPFRLNNTPTQPLQITKRNTISSPSKPAAGPPPPSTRPIRRPRISRSKVIAKLGEKRAAVASPRASKARSSVQGRRSLGVKPGPAQGVDLAKARMRKSEAARRRSRVVDKSVVGRRSEGAVLRR